MSILTPEGPDDSQTTRLTSAQWWVLVTACLGWMFDTFDQRLFILARASAMTALLPPGASSASQMQASTWVTAIFIAGWATGGLLFGVYGDRIGRVRTMALTIAIYSVFTGLSALSTHVYDFGFYRFMTGLGIGGEFAAGAALIAECLPSRVRPYSLGFVQVIAMLGTLLGTLCSMVIEVSTDYSGISGWRLLFLIGAFPAVMLIPLRFKVTESGVWLKSKIAADEAQATLGGIRELFSGPWRKVSLVGIALGFAGQLGIWAIGTWTPDLMRLVLNKDQALSAMEKSRILGSGLILKDLTSALGIVLLTVGAQRFGRKPAFAVSFGLSFIAAIVTFHGMRDTADIWWMMPLIGATVWSVLGLYSLYYPELFPTRLRSSGIGLCYNAARYLTAIGILGMGQLLSLFASYGEKEPLRSAAISLSLCYVVGLLALWWARETKGEPLPD